MTGLKLFIMGLFGRLRHQCANDYCYKTFYRPQIVAVRDGYEIDVCPHCGCSSYIVV
jgi:hypothetical protein